MKEHTDILMFVYGTLRRGYGNHRYMRGSTFLGMAKTVDAFTLYQHGIPYVNAVKATCPIVGEVYRVPSSDLPAVDRLESHPHGYTRRETPVRMEETGAVVTAWLYFFDHDLPDDLLNSSGDFANPVFPAELQQEEMSEDEDDECCGDCDNCLIEDCEYADWDYDAIPVEMI